MSRVRAALVPAAVAAVLAAGASGCGSDDAPFAEPSSPASSTTVTSATGSPSAAPSTTPLGTSFALGTPVVLGWTPRQGVAGTIGLTVRTIQEAPARQVLTGYQLDGRTRRSTAYLAHLKVTNQGTTDLGGRVVPLYVLDTDGDLVEPTQLGADLAPCRRGVLPALFAAGSSVSSCLVFLAPHGTSLASVQFRSGAADEPVSWVGPTTPLPDRRFGHRHGPKRQ